jgi:hypothetical protein
MRNYVCAKFPLGKQINERIPSPYMATYTTYEYVLVDSQAMRVLSGPTYHSMPKPILLTACKYGITLVHVVIENQALPQQTIIPLYRLSSPPGRPGLRV